MENAPVVAYTLKPVKGFTMGGAGRGEENGLVVKGCRSSADGFGCIIIKIHPQVTSVSPGQKHGSGDCMHAASLAHIILTGRVRPRTPPTGKLLPTKKAMRLTSTMRHLGAMKLQISKCHSSVSTQGFHPKNRIRFSLSLSLSLSFCSFSLSLSLLESNTRKDTSSSTTNLGL